VKILIDANVLFPTVQREVVLSQARAGAFTPLWSPRILEEWRRAAEKLGPDQGVIVAGEIAALKAEWSDAEITPETGSEAQFWLPDPNDIHVLAAAVQAEAPVILTQNLKDFPASELTPLNIRAVHPDAFLTDLLADAPDPVAKAVMTVLERASDLSPDEITQASVLKRARLPRLRKAMIRGGYLT
jgi:predicted nucleic acid-binding protein